MAKKKYKPLHDYLEITGMTIAAFANLIDVEPATVYRWFDGTHAMSKKKARQIEKRTSGKIKAEDLL